MIYYIYDDKKYYEETLRTVILFIENIFYNHFGKNVSSNYGCKSL